MDCSARRVVPYPTRTRLSFACPASDLGDIANGVRSLAMSFTFLHLMHTKQRPSALNSIHLN